ncbi:unnamed protein product [Laminaria digitata]
MRATILLAKYFPAGGARLLRNHPMHQPIDCLFPGDKEKLVRLQYVYTCGVLWVVVSLIVGESHLCFRVFEYRYVLLRHGGNTLKKKKTFLKFLADWTPQPL